MIHLVVFLLNKNIISFKTILLISWIVNSYHWIVKQVCNVSFYMYYIIQQLRYLWSCVKFPKLLPSWWQTLYFFSQMKENKLNDLTQPESVRTAWHLWLYLNIACDWLIKLWCWNQRMDWRLNCTRPLGMLLNIWYAVLLTQAKKRMVCFSLTLSPRSRSPSPTTAQMSRIWARRNADGYYRSGLIRALERSCSLCMSLLIMIRVRVAETLQKCWPHPLPWAAVLAGALFQTHFSRSPLSYHSHFISSSLKFFIFPFFLNIRPCCLACWESDNFGRLYVSGHYIFSQCLSNR